MVTVSAYPIPETGVIHQEPLTEVYVKDARRGTGTLYITESLRDWFVASCSADQDASNDVFIVQLQVFRLLAFTSNVVWLGAGGDGLVFNYPNIAIHAISRDITSFPHECLFLMLDIVLDCDGPHIGDDDEESEEHTSTDVRFVPSQKEHLDAMYQAMRVCQELHPDPEQDDSGDEFFGAEDMMGDGPVLSAQGLSNMARMERLLAANGDTNGSALHDGIAHSDEEMEEDGQFEDA